MDWIAIGMFHVKHDTFVRNEKAIEDVEDLLKKSQIRGLEATLHTMFPGCVYSVLHKIEYCSRHSWREEEGYWIQVTHNNNLYYGFAMFYSKGGPLIAAEFI